MKEKDFTRKEVKTRREALVLVVRKGANGGQPQAGFCVSSAMNEERVVLNLYRYGSFWLIKPKACTNQKVVRDTSCLTVIKASRSAFLVGTCSFLPISQ